MTYILGGALWLLCWEEMIGKVNGSREICEEDVATIEEGQDHGFNQEVTCDQNLDIFRGQNCQDWLRIECTSSWLPRADTLPHFFHPS